MFLSANPAPVVVPQPDSRLEQLTARYDAAKAAVERAEAEFKEITDAIKVELISARPGYNSIEVTSVYLDRPLRLSASSRKNFERKKFELIYPGMYDRFTTESTVWQMRQVGNAS